MKYIEISKEAFRAIVPDDCPTIKAEWVVNSWQCWYYTKGVELLVIEQSTSPKQYYIADINS